MPRYFIEVSYKGTSYSGFQVQQNAVTIQSEVERALGIFFRQKFSLTGASRTDAGVHALQNYFHFDTDQALQSLRGNNNFNELKNSQISSPGENLGEAGSGFLYHLNAILPRDIVIKRILPVDESAHCRFDAVLREYKYYIYANKDPFLQDKAFYYPYHLDIEKLNQAAQIVLGQKDFTSFSKRNTQVNNFICDIEKSEWVVEKNTLVYHVESNRFLRGMVKGLTGTMLRVGTGKMSFHQFAAIIKSRDCSQADFSVPSHALFLVAVLYNKY